MMVLRPACSLADSIESRALVKFRFTGILPAKTTARFATTPPLPGGRTIPTRRSGHARLR